MFPGSGKHAVPLLLRRDDFIENINQLPAVLNSGIDQVLSPRSIENCSILRLARVRVHCGRYGLTAAVPATLLVAGRRGFLRRRCT